MQEQITVGVFYYDRFANHEIIIALHEMRKQQVVHLGLEAGVYRSTEGQPVMAEKAISDVGPADFDLLILPGGITDSLYENEALLDFIRGVTRSGGKVAGICGGTFLMAKSGILANRRCTGHFIAFNKEEPEYGFFEKARIVDEDVVVDREVITARGKAYVEFGLLLGKEMGVLTEDADYAEEYAWLKNLV